MIESYMLLYTPCGLDILLLIWTISHHINLYIGNFHIVIFQLFLIFFAMPQNTA